jgi:hypothetical protein
MGDTATAERLRAAGRVVAERHRQCPDRVVESTLMDYAEVLRDDGWSLRSALVRVGQRDPRRSSAVHDAIRRCDSALRPFRRTLERHGTDTDRALTLDRLTSTSGERAGTGAADRAPHGPAPEARVTDLARLTRSARDDAVGPDLAAATGAVVDGYREVTDLGEDEVAAIPFLVAALDLDRLAAILARWAVTAAEPVPVDDLDRLRRAAWSALDDAGAPVEEGPPPGARSRRGWAHGS